MATIKEQEKDRLTPVSTRVPVPYLSFRTDLFISSVMLNFLQIVEALSNAYFGPDYSQVCCHNFTIMHYFPDI